MRKLRWNISAGAVLLFALFYFFDSVGFVAALVPAALAHELGHILALRCFHCGIIRVSIRAIGVELDYAPRAEGLRAAVCSAAGPLAGALYGLAALRLQGDFWRLTGTVSLMLSAFNCLPVLPLDGGRIAAAALGPARARALSVCVALGLCAAGAVMAARFAAWRLLLVGVWLLFQLLPPLRHAKGRQEKACQFKQHRVE